MENVINDSTLLGVSKRSYHVSYNAKTLFNKALSWGWVYTAILKFYMTAQKCDLHKEPKNPKQKNNHILLV